MAFAYLDEVLETQRGALAAGARNFNLSNLALGDEGLSYVIESLAAIEAPGKTGVDVRS